MNLRYSFSFLFLNHLRAFRLITPKRSVRRLWCMKIYVSPIQCNHLMRWALHWFFRITTVIIRSNVNNYPYGLIPDVCSELLNILLLRVLLLLPVSYKLHTLLLRLLIYGLECLQPLLWHVVLIQLLVETLQGLETQDWVRQGVAVGFAWEQGLLRLLIVN